MALRKLVVFVGIPILTIWVGFIWIKPRFGADFTAFREPRIVNALCSIYAEYRTEGGTTDLAGEIEALTGEKPFQLDASQRGVHVSLWRFFILEHGLFFLDPDAVTPPDASEDSGYTHLGECLYSYDARG